MFLKLPLRSIVSEVVAITTNWLQTETIQSGSSNIGSLTVKDNAKLSCSLISGNAFPNFYQTLFLNQSQLEYKTE
jgi:hypothetical protein